MRIVTALAASLFILGAAVPASARNVEVGPIWNQADAQKKCPAAAAAWKGKWSGHWWTTVAGQMSVCQIVKIKPKAVEAGPIWNQADAKTKCTVLAASHKAKWTGHWWTTVAGKMSVCQLDYN
ncbi:mannan-binding lectin [Thalassococcus lentus]|uniref:Mannan-binding lectin n=1 Tax=Thalassococcus lentus TaxID=1210524 RepID=A0ABT4XVS8_9RHOB|nr:mannan-binding lectin [Thalassococcus lentus]MDA7426070.1 mannan-binding lectin [Thalassococcus lentus]